jgi:uncharacterized protein YraI
MLGRSMNRLLIVMTALLTLATSAADAAETCVINDTSGTPLNVRAKLGTGAPILGALNNDVLVVVRERRGQWARIVPHKAAGKSGGVG